MSLRPASPDDIGGITAFLRGRLEGSMFLMSNLAAHGLNGTHSNAMRLWVAGRRPVAGVVGLTNGGMVLPQWPDGDWAALRPLVGSRPIAGLVGEAGQVDAARRALGLGSNATRLASNEHGFTLDLAALRLPESADFQLRIPGPDDRAVMVAWRRFALEETQGVQPDASLALATRDVEGWIARGSHRLLVHGDVPVSMTGFNASLPDAVQVGGVYPPPALRGRGHARRAVGLHLAEARARGVGRAILFASNPAAIRAYRSLGFVPQGRIALVLFPASVAVPFSAGNHP